MKSKIIAKNNQEEGQNAKKNNLNFSIFKNGSDESPSQEINLKKYKKVLMLKKGKNLYQKICNIPTIKNAYNFQNRIVLTEQSIWDPEHDESILQSIFHFKSIQKIQIKEDYVYIHIKENQKFTSSMSNISYNYMIDRFQSFGDDYFHQIAKKMKKIDEQLNLRKKPQKINIQNDPKEDQNKKFWLDSFLQKMKGKAYFLKIVPDQMIVSKELIKLLGKTLEQFSIECIKYRSFIDSFFTSQNYKYLLNKRLDYELLNFEYLSGKISLNELLESATTEYIETMVSQSGKRTKVRFRGTMPSTFCACMEVREIISEEDQLGQILSKLKEKDSENPNKQVKNKLDTNKFEKIQTTIQKYKQDQIKQNANTIRYLTPLSHQFLSKNQKICSYKILPN